MDNLSHGQIIGIDVRRDWLDIHSLLSNQRLRLPNTAEGHGHLSEMALSQSALVCFEATGGQVWKLWAALDAAGGATRQLPPTRIKAFAASRGTQAKTDRIDAELIACFMEFRPDAERTLPHEKIRLLRALVSRRGQLVETRKRLLAQIKAHRKAGSADTFKASDAEPEDLLNQQIAMLEAQIEQVIVTDDGLAATSCILRSVPGIAVSADKFVRVENRRWNAAMSSGDIRYCGRFVRGDDLSRRHVSGFDDGLKHAAIP